MTTLSMRSFFSDFAGWIGGVRAYISREGRWLVSGFVLSCAVTGPARGPQAPLRLPQSEVVSPEPDLRPGATIEEDLPDDEGDDEERFANESPEEHRRPEPHLVEEVPHPLAGWTSAQLQKAVREQPETLGAMSVGAPNGGALFNAVQLPEDPAWERVDPSHAWGTQETVDGISRAVSKVRQQFPDSPRLPIGHLSGRNGGHINPHRSHQAGTDVDIGFYYRSEVHRWYLRGTEQTLDLPRTWALVRAFITETDVRFILLDHSIQGLLRQYATSIGEDAAWLDDVFDGRGHARPALIRHAPGHATHLHVRFYSPIAEETGRRCYPALLAGGLIKPATHFVTYKAKKGDTLLSLAKRFGTTVKAIKRANGLRSNTILAKRSYKIPSTGRSVHQSRPIDVPERRLPPVVASSNAASTSLTGTEPGPSNEDGCDSDSADGGDCE